MHKCMNSMFTHLQIFIRLQLFSLFYHGLVLYRHLVKKVLTCYQYLLCLKSLLNYGKDLLVIVLPRTLFHDADGLSLESQSYSDSEGIGCGQDDPSLFLDGNFSFCYYIQTSSGYQMIFL